MKSIKTFQVILKTISRLKYFKKKEKNKKENHEFLAKLFPYVFSKV